MVHWRCCVAVIFLHSRATRRFPLYSTKRSFSFPQGCPVSRFRYYILYCCTSVLASMSFNQSLYKSLSPPHHFVPAQNDAYGSVAHPTPQAFPPRISSAGTMMPSLQLA